ncbi:MAG: hypothetical protein IT537_05495 [Hyphomicrobiales bacterium]|nr:hypothetical protein [Hyphomicrobiales bacterium]
MARYSLITGALLIFSSITPVSAQVREPGNTPEATVMALTKPYDYAWQLFLYLNRQARQGVAGEVDELKRTIAEYDADRDVVWETWALASGLDINENGVVANKSEVFKNPATQPVPWESLQRGGSAAKVLSQPFKSSPLVNSAVGRLIPRSNLGPLIAPPGTDPRSDETRMNRSTYETVRSKNLYSVEGLEAAAAAAKAANVRMVVNFEPPSKEVKARWIRLRQCDDNPNCSEKNRYHWRTVQTSDGARVYGLVTLHIITKDLPNWFWADFGHIDCEKPEGECAHPSVDARPAETPLVDPSTAATGGRHPQTLNTKWAQYRLRGVQIDFVTSTGADVVLSNPVIENTFQKTSTCMTCHANATVGIRGLASETGTSLPKFAGRAKFVLNAKSQDQDLGRPHCARFVNRAESEPFTVPCNGPFDDESKTIYFQTDFLWSLPFRAFSTSDQ